MASVGDTLAQAVSRLKLAHIETARIDSDILLREALGWSRADMIAHHQDEVPPDILNQFWSWVGRRERAEPIAYILGRAAFWKSEFKVSPAVLIPRPETEGVVEHGLVAIEGKTDPVILDIGTGSGAILISLLLENSGAHGLGSDISRRALDIAQTNITTHSLSSRAKLKHSDYFENITGCFDLIVSNPPYIEEKVLPTLKADVIGFEPPRALNGGTDGLNAYRVICEHAKKFMKPKASLVMEIGFDQKVAVTKLLKTNSYQEINCYQDLAGHDRIMTAKI